MLTKRQLEALRGLACGRTPSDYMCKVLHRKRLIYSYLEVTKRGRKILSETGWADLFRYYLPSLEK
jgi:hypothetical protein